jgi:hypothetical protein
MVEFALTAPIIVLLLLGLVEMGHAFNSYMTIVAASRDSARLGSQFGTGDASQDMMRNLIFNETNRLENGGVPDEDNCGNDNAGICIDATTVGGEPRLNVKVCYDHELIIGVPGFGDGPLTLCSDTTIRVANPGG